MRKIILFGIFLMSINLYAADYYWVGGTGNWSEISHWATSSGGTNLYSTVPGGGDNVYFDANSFTATGQTVSVNTTAYCNDMEWTGALYTPTINQGTSLYINGDLQLITAMNWSLAGEKYFTGAGTQNIDLAGQNNSGSLYFTGTGTYNLLDSIRTTGDFFFNGGTFNSNGYKMHCNQFYCTGTNTVNINLSTSKITCTYSRIEYASYLAVSLSNANMNIDADEATFNLIGTSTYTNFKCTQTDTFGTIHTYSNAPVFSIGPNSVADSVIFHGSSKGASINASSTIKYLYSENEIQLSDSVRIHKAIIEGSFTTKESQTIDTLILLGTSSSDYTLEEGKCLHILDSVQFPTGTCKLNYELKSSDNTVQAEIKKTTGSITINQITIKSIKGITGATYVANNAPYEDGNNTKWTITTLSPTNYYGVGGTGSWIEPTNWSLSSGGTAQSASGCIPSILDSVFFDANSFNSANDTVYIDAESFCGNMDWTGATDTPTLSGEQKLRCFGGLTAIAALNWDLNGELRFEGTGVHSIDFAGQILKDSTTFDCTGEYTLADSLHSDGPLFFTNGLIVSNNHKIHCERFEAIGSDTLSLILGNSLIEVDWHNDDFREYSFELDHDADYTDLDETTIKILGNGFYTNFRAERTHDFGNIYLTKDAYYFTIYLGSADSVFLTCDTCKVQMTRPATLNYLLAGGCFNSFDNNTIKYAELRGDFTSQASCTFDTLIFAPNTGSPTYSFQRYQTCTITDSIKFPNASCSQSYTIQSSSLGQNAFLSKSSGTVVADFAVLNSITGTGGATFTCSNNPSNDGNNVGWTISTGTSTDYYWVGGTGDWDDPTQWSLTSGGTPQTTSGCLPTAADNVYFDANSFSAVSQIVNLNVNASCKTMNWTGATNTPTFDGDNTLDIYGQLDIITSLNWDITGMLSFLGSSTINIDFKGKVLDHDVLISNNGTINLTDSLHTNKDFRIRRGTFNSNNHKIHCSKIYLTGTDTLIINLGTSLWEFDYNSNHINNFQVTMSHTDLTLNGGSSTFSDLSSGSYTHFNCSSPQTFGKMVMRRSMYNFNLNGSTVDSLFSLRTIGASRIAGTPTINYVYSASIIRIQGRCTIGRLDAEKSFTSYSSAIVDTLMLYMNSSGANHFLGANDTLYVDSIYINSNGCYKHELRSENSGVTAYISAPSGMSVSLDFLNLQDISAIGGASFDAGANTADLGNNTGWTFNGNRNTFRLKYKFYCLTPGYTKEVKTDPDGSPTSVWWRNTVTPFDTFNTNIDTIQVTTPGDYVYVMAYGNGCNIEDSVFIRHTTDAAGIHQNYSNNAEDEDWFNCSNWDQGYIPDSISNAVITTGDTVKISADTAWCYDLTNNGIIEMSGGVLMIFGDFENNGTFNHTGGIVNLHGTGNDSISGTSRMVIDSLVIDKNGSIVVGNEVEVNGNADFLDGILYTNAADSFVFENGTTNGGNDTSFIDGPAYRRGMPQFIFPLGDNEIWARLGISQVFTTADISTMKAEYHHVLPTDTGSLLSPLVKVSEYEYWQLDQITGSGSFRVRLYFEDTARSQIQDITDLRVAKYTGTDWMDMGIHNSSMVNGKGFVTSNYVTTFSPFTFGSLLNANFLPVDFINAQAEWSNKDALITWQTANEQNNSHFEVEYSKDNKEFIAVGKVESQNPNSQSVLNYSFSHLNAYSNANKVTYYRIKQVDFDGTISYSRSVVLEKNTSLEILVYPNPNNGDFDVQVGSSNGVVSIFDIYGRKVYLNQFTSNKISLSLSNLRKGTYTMVVRSGIQVTTKKLVIY